MQTACYVLAKCALLLASALMKVRHANLAGVGGRWSHEMNLPLCHCCQGSLPLARRGWHADVTHKQKGFSQCQGTVIAAMLSTFDIHTADERQTGLIPPFLKAFQLLSGWHFVEAFKGPMFWGIYLKTLSVSKNQAYFTLSSQQPGKTCRKLMLC